MEMAYLTANHEDDVSSRPVFRADGGSKKIRGSLKEGRSGRAQAQSGNKG